MRRDVGIYIVFQIMCISYIYGDKSPIFLNETYFAGLVELDKGDIFYWLFKSRNKDENCPLIVWLTGGPGCSGLDALFTENGPFKVNSDLSLEYNPWSWNRETDLLFLDQPFGTGFSRGSHLSNQEEVSEYLYKFVVEWMSKEEFRMYMGREIYITGESYAGHYIPPFLSYVRERGDPRVNIKGAAIGNGWVNPALQYPSYVTYAYEHQLIGNFRRWVSSGLFALCDLLLKGPKILATMECFPSTWVIQGISIFPFFNQYDIRIPCQHPPTCYPTQHIHDFLSLSSVLALLHLPSRKWTDCNAGVFARFLTDWVVDYSPHVSRNLDSHLPILIYSGDQDFICNWMGGLSWVENMQWEGAQGFRESKWRELWGDGVLGGVYKKFLSLHFVRVFGAGHMVPMDTPQFAYTMIMNFIHSQGAAIH